jgi:hypothetical protein
MTRSEIYSLMKSSVAEIEFKKVNGDSRIMKATLMTEHLPDQKDIEEYISERTQNEDTLAVWDTEKTGWRSFKISNLISINGVYINQ